MRPDAVVVEHFPACRAACVPAVSARAPGAVREAAHDPGGVVIEPSEQELEAATRTAWGVWHLLVRQLMAVDGLTLTGLDRVRAVLRVGIWSLKQIPAGFESTRELLLHDVSMQLADRRGAGYAEYYRGASDLLPVPPDDLSGLDDGQGDGAP